MIGRPGDMEEPLVHAALPPGDETEVDQPGLSTLRALMVNRLRVAPGAARVRKDAIAGLNSALSSVPDGMAMGLLAGVNPIHGLYACMVAPIAGGLLASSQLMVVTTTSAAALGAGETLEHLAYEQRGAALVLLVVMTGLFQLVFGLLRLGQLTRFVSYSVMTGFVSGIAARTILTQLDTITGFQSTGANVVVRALDLLANIPRIDPSTLGVTALTAVLIATLSRTKLGRSGTLFAIAIPSLLVWWIGPGVRVVGDLGEIAQGIPGLVLPRLSDLSVELVSGAAALSVVILVQGAGVSQSVPNPDGSVRRASRDFVAQGVANIASGLFRGLPVGGSLSSTALSVASGASSRWAAIFAGLLMASVVVVFPGLAARVAMPSLAMLLIYASSRVIRPDAIRAVIAAGASSMIGGGATFVTTLLLPIQVAVATGVALSIILHVYVASGDISVVELIQREDGEIVETPPDRILRSGQVTVVDVYGSLFFAGARTLERRLPQPEGSRNAVLIVRLRRRAALGSTLVSVLADYARRLEAADGRLYLTGLAPGALSELAGSRRFDIDGPVRAFEVTPVVGASTRAARADAEAWLVEVLQR
ncbi:MAG: hypothetical protein LBE86_14150 [Gemmobacter sp.]|nr:hypothetical protein [Gemmobacter sp.]